MALLALSQALTLGGAQKEVPGPVTDPRAEALRRRYHDPFGGEQLPVPVESITEDLLGLSINEDEELASGMLLPASGRSGSTRAKRKKARAAAGSRSRMSLAIGSVSASTGAARQ